MQTGTPKAGSHLCLDAPRSLVAPESDPVPLRPSARGERLRCRASWVRPLRAVPVRTWRAACAAALRLRERHLDAAVVPVHLERILDAHRLRQDHVPEHDLVGAEIAQLALEDAELARVL